MAKLIDLIVSGKSAFANDISAKTIYSTRLYMSGAISTCNTGGTWVSGMTNAAIRYNDNAAISTSSYHPFLSMKASGGHVVNFGGLGNTIGFYGYYSGRTANSYDWSFTVNSSTGKWYMSSSITASAFITSGGANTQVVRGDGTLQTISSLSVSHASTADNADTVDNLHVHSGRNNEANKIVRTDGSGYIQAGWINTTSGDMGTTAATRIYCSNDAYIRYKTLANFSSDIAGQLYWANVKVSTSSNTATSPTFGNTTTNKLTISNTEAIGHLVFSRGNYNYITAPTGGSIGFCVNGNTIGSANCEMIISDGNIFPGTTNVTSLGKSSISGRQPSSSELSSDASKNPTCPLMLRLFLPSHSEITLSSASIYCLRLGEMESNAPA